MTTLSSIPAASSSLDQAHQQGSPPQIIPIPDASEMVKAMPEKLRGSETKNKKKKLHAR